jgi:hypothetical protein
VFLLDKPERVLGQLGAGPAEYRVPTLPAYAIEYAELRVNRSTDGVGKADLLLDRDFEIKGDIVIWPTYNPPLGGGVASERLIVHFHGIRDYGCLFPQMGCEAMTRRVGEYYREAEICFEQSAWFSFAVMCGAVFEGLLFDRYPKNL